MEATHRIVCQEDLVNPLTSVGVQVSFILVVSHVFHVVLRAIGQPGPIAQILAGMLLGPTGLSNIRRVRAFFFQASAADYYEVFGFFFRIIFMFLIGLETDVRYLRRNLRLAGFVAVGGLVVGIVFGLISSYFVYKQFDAKSNMISFFGIICSILCYTASPVVIRLSADLKFATSDIGRLAVASALITEMTCLLIFNLVLAFRTGVHFLWGMLCLVLVVILAFIIRYLSNFLNKRNSNTKYLRSYELFFILSLVLCISMVIEVVTFNSTLFCFLLGLLVPKEGKTARTLLHKLAYSVHNFVLPIYFGYLGFQFDGGYLLKWKNALIVLCLVVLTILSKLCGTLAACYYLKIPLNEGIFLSFVLNLKGNADIILIGGASKILINKDPRAYSLFLITLVVNTIISGPIVAFLIRKEEKLFAHTRTTLEYIENSEEELRMLACVYGPRHVPGIVAVIASLSGSNTAPTTPYLIHLIELLKKKRNNLSYHELADDEMSDEEGYGGNDVQEIYDAVDNFVMETKIFILLSKAVSSFETLYEDVCNVAEDLRVSNIIIPFHKHQRIDGKWESGKEGIRTTNQKILRHAPCSVGIMMYRAGKAGDLDISHLLVSGVVQQIVTLFFCGPDDREAVAWSTRMITHAHINLTVIRFLPDRQNEKIYGISDINSGILMTLPSVGIGATSEIDNAYLADFYNRYVTSGRVAYIEKHVRNGEDTAIAIRDILGMYSLFIVGKGGRGHSPMTTGMSDWEECPELGAVGDLLASSDLNTTSSVLVVQQHRQSKDFLEE